VLTHHDSKNPDQPHLRTAVSGGFEFIVNFLSLVGTFHGCSTLVDAEPLVAITSDRWKQTRIVLGIGVDAPSVGRIRTRRIAGANALLHERTTIFASCSRMVVPVIFHRQSFWADGYTFRGKRNVVLVLLVSGLTFVEVNEMSETESWREARPSLG